MTKIDLELFEGKFRKQKNFDVFQKLRENNFLNITYNIYNFTPFINTFASANLF